MSVGAMQNALFAISLMLVVLGCAAWGAGCDFGSKVVERIGIVAASIGAFILSTMLFKLYILWMLS